MAKKRVVHFTNHFFAGVGGEEKADTPVSVRDGPVGPGQGLQAQLGGNAQIVATVYCGDNYYPEYTEKAREEALAILKEKGADLVIAGPAFGSGRYGQACVDLLHAASEKLGIPGVTGLHPNNAGMVFYEAYKDRDVYAIATTESAAGMAQALQQMAALALKLASGEPIGPAKKEGYIPRGIRQRGFVGVSGARRAVDMLIARLEGSPFETELPIVMPDQVSPPAPVPNIKKATVALASSTGMVPWGNPDRMPSKNTNRWIKYSLEGLSALEKGKWEVMHSGFDTKFVLENPHLMVPLDAMRELEDSGQVGTLYNQFYSFSGHAGQPNTAKRLGEEMAKDMKASGVDAVVMTAT